MATSQTGAREELQLIPTNAGGRSFAGPPKALQSQVTPTDLFYVRNHWKGAPEIDADAYRLSVGGEVAPAAVAEHGRSEGDAEPSLPGDFRVLRQRADSRILGEADALGDGEGDRTWDHGATRSGSCVSLADVLNMAEIGPNAVEVMFEGADHGPDEVVGDPEEVTYERSLPMDKALHPDTMLAWEMNGETLTPMHGYPLRLVVPGWYGMCSVKWLVGIHVLDHKFEGFYQIERYRVMNGPDSDEFYTYLTGMKVKSIITDPAPGDQVPVGDYVVSGAAWSGESDITRIEVSVDGGNTWTDARITVPRSGYSWTRWECDWEIPGGGRLRDYVEGDE